MSVKTWKKIYDRELIDTYLPFMDYDEKTGIYFTNDDGLGMILECSPLIYPSDNIVNAINSGFQILPNNTYIQFMMFASPDITNKVKNWSVKKVKTNNNKIAKNIINNYKEFLFSRTSKSISDNFTAPVRDFKLLISIKIGGKEKINSIFSDIFNIENIKNYFFSNKNYIKEEIINNKELREKFLLLCSFKDRMIGSFKKAYLNPKILSPNALIKFYYAILNQNHDFNNIPEYDGSNINNFLFANNNKIEIFDNEILIDKKYIKTLSVKEYPSKWCMYDIIKYCGDLLRDSNHSCPFLLTMNITKLNDINGKDKIVRSATVTNSQQMPYSLFPKLKYIHKDLDYGMDKLQNGENVYYFNMQIALFANSKEEIHNYSGQTRGYFKSLYFALEDDNFVIFPVLLSMLPLGHDLKMQEFLGHERGRVVFTDNIIDLLPITSDWYGVNCQVPLISPRGQFFGIDLFAHKTGGFNAFVIGTTGSGKSVFLQWIALNYWLSNYKIWIIDIGRSYENLCQVLGGQFIEFDKKSKISLNPFTSIKDEEMLEEYLDFLCGLFLMMGLPNEITLHKQQEKLMKQYVADAIKQSYKKYGNKSETNTIIYFLEKINKSNIDKRLEDFIKHLYSFKRGNNYGEILNGECKIDFKKDMVVLECGQLENMPDMLNPVLMVLIFQISKEIYLTSKNKNNLKRNIVILDEAHKFLGKSDHVEKFIEQAYRRFRKHEASMIIGTQGFEDLYGGENLSIAGRVIVQNSNWNFFLMQKSVSKQKIKQDDYYNLSPFDEELMDSIEAVDGEYSDILIMNDKIITKGRLVLSNYLKALLFTNAEDKACIKDLINKGHSYKEAIEYFLEEVKNDLYK